VTLEAGAPVLLASVSDESDDAIRVLLIEDGVIDRGFLTDKLSKQGFAVRTVASLAGAPDAARDADVIVLQCDRAINSGIDLLVKLHYQGAQKLASLKFLGHWVGDIHQPLHVSFEDDRGGNSILVTGICGTNLYSAWDTCLVLGAVGEDVNEAATEPMKTITPARIESWAHSKPMDWANESFAIAEQAQTKYCIRQGASCEQPAGKVTIDAVYVVANTPIVREQLQKAGIRLTHLLDAALGK
jgi:hypothetical protein